MVIDTRALTPEIIKEMVHVCHSIHNVPDIPSKQNIKWIWETHFENLFLEDVHEHLPEDHPKTGVA
ncbi:MAG: 4Fe-4S ferredoxin, partial [Desulfomicrobiaceae bacterium]|nr:4Fe-4S ferredoxin [Desulfomicrobiaceae bacterium]